MKIVQLWYYSNWPRSHSHSSRSFVCVVSSSCLNLYSSMSFLVMHLTCIGACELWFVESEARFWFFSPPYVPLLLLHTSCMGGCLFLLEFKPLVFIVLFPGKKQRFLLGFCWSLNHWKKKKEMKHWKVESMCSLFFLLWKKRSFFSPSS